MNFNVHFIVFSVQLICQLHLSTYSAMSDITSTICFNLWLRLLFTHVIHSAYTPLLFDYINSHNCSSNITTYFDSLNLQCRNCKSNRIATVNRLNCICPSGTIPVSDDGTCQKCQQGKCTFFISNGIDCFYSFT